MRSLGLVLVLALLAGVLVWFLARDAGSRAMHELTPHESAPSPAASAPEPPSPGFVEGRVQREDGTPVADAVVSLWSGTHVEPRAHSDAAGRFRIDGLAPGQYTLAATAERLASRQGESLTVMAAAPTPVVLTLLAHLPATVRVRSAYDGPVTVTWFDDREEVQTLEALPGQDLPLGELFPGRHRFRLSAGKRTREHLVIVRGTEGELVFELPLE